MWGHGGGSVHKSGQGPQVSGKRGPRKRLSSLPFSLGSCCHQVVKRPSVCGSGTEVSQDPVAGPALRGEGSGTSSFLS